MQENIMGTLPVGRLLVKVSVPLILSMLCYKGNKMHYAALSLHI